MVMGMFKEFVRQTSEQFDVSHSIRGQLITSRHGKNVSKYYIKLEKIGDGSIGTIYKVARKDRGKVGSNEKKNLSWMKGLLMMCPGCNNADIPKVCYAMKQIDLKRVPPSFVEELKNEIEILKTLDHPNIIRAYETFDFEKSNQLSLIMELCTGGDLFSRMPYTEGRVLTMIQQVLRAISYMHNLDVMHRDSELLDLNDFLYLLIHFIFYMLIVKLENILFENKKKKSDVKVRINQNLNNPTDELILFIAYRFRPCCQSSRR